MLARESRRLLELRTVFRKVRPFNQFGLVGTRNVKVQSIEILEHQPVFTLLYLRCLEYVVYKVTDSELIQGCNFERPFICFGDSTRGRHGGSQRQGDGCIFSAWKFGTGSASFA